MKDFWLYLNIEIEGSKFLKVTAPNMIKAILKAYEDYDVSQHNIIIAMSPSEQPVTPPQKERKKYTKKT